MNQGSGPRRSGVAPPAKIGLSYDHPMPQSKPSRRYELVVFDWDGTLMDSAGLIARCIQSAARDLGLPVPEQAMALHVIGLGLRDALSMACPQLAVDDYPKMAER